MLRTSLRSDTQATDSTCKGSEGKQCRYEKTAPIGAGSFAEKQEEQEGVSHMKKEVGQVMACRVESVKVTIEHVREPG